MKAPLLGKAVCFTGKMETIDRGEQKIFLQSIGGKLILEITPELNLLVVGKYAVNNKIVKYAQDNAIEMIDEQAYLALLKTTKVNVVIKTKKTARNNRQLSNRELEVVKAVAAGKKRYKEIAAELGISINTVKFHLKNIYQITGISDIVSLSRAEFLINRQKLPRNYPRTTR